MKPRMSMITLGVDDMRRAINFYQTGLGFPRRAEDQGDDIAFFTLNGTWLGLYDRKALAEDANVSSEGSGYNSFAIAHNVDNEQQVIDTLAQAERAGATIVKPAQKVFWGGFSGYFKDPDGHLWEVAYNPFTWIGPQDD